MVLMYLSLILFTNACLYCLAWHESISVKERIINFMPLVGVPFKRTIRILGLLAIIFYVMLLCGYVSSWLWNGGSQVPGTKLFSLMMTSDSTLERNMDKSRKEVNKVLPDHMKIKRRRFTIKEVTKGLANDFHNDLLPWVKHNLNEVAFFPTPVKLVLGVNIAVWLAWKYVPNEWMSEYFVRRHHSVHVGLREWLVKEIMDPKWYTRLSASFSHQSVYSLIPTLVLTGFIGKNVCKQLGGFNFIAFIVSSAMASMLLDEIFHYALYGIRTMLDIRTADSSNTAVLLGFSGVVSSMLVLHASSRRPNEDVSEEDIDNVQKDVRQQFVKNSAFLMLQKLFKVPLTPGFGLQLAGLLWGFIYARAFAPSDKF